MYLCLIFSRACIFFHLQYVFRSLWSMRNYIHIQLCLTIMAAQLVFVIAVDKTDNQVHLAYPYTETAFTKASCDIV